jgi:hypothetical protein
MQKDEGGRRKNESPDEVFILHLSALILCFALSGVLFYQAPASVQS